MLSFFQRGVLDEILNLIGSVSEEFPSYSFRKDHMKHFGLFSIDGTKFYLQHFNNFLFPILKKLHVTEESQLIKLLVFSCMLQFIHK